jgi:hypothetical protein
MSISRWIVVVPVLVGFAVTGSAVARMLPAETVRDTVYQTCQHNGVHFNKQGHANCGLHKGWAQQEPVTEPTTEPGTGDTGDTGGTVDTTATTAPTGHGKGHAKHEHTTSVRGAKSHGGATTHGAKSHGGKAHGKKHG